MFKFLSSKFMNAEIPIKDIVAGLKAMDKNNNGKISVKEIVKAVENLLL